MRYPLCCQCRAKAHRPNQRTCVDCHAKYIREWRSRNQQTPEQRRKNNCRSYAKVYLKRGKLVKNPCQKCGSQKSEMHHEDYSKPLQVTWLCRPCHLALHAAQRKSAK